MTKTQIDLKTMDYYTKQAQIERSREIAEILTFVKKQLSFLPKVSFTRNFTKQLG